MKTLYISDLDGTLLTPEATVSDFTKAKLNLLAEHGVCFSVASARTAATVGKMFADTTLAAPAVLMNGAVIYDISKKEYVRTYPFSEESKSQLLDAVSGTSGFIYTVDEGKLHTFYERNDTEHSRKFREERETLYGKVFTKTASFTDLADRSCIYFSTAGEEKDTSRLRETLAAIPGLHIEYYRDIYNEAFFYLEACAEGVSKSAAAREIREKGGFDRMVAFGDNLNDLPLFEASDEAFAVANAKEDVKNAADAVIGRNCEDAVVRYILDREGIE